MKTLRANSLVFYLIIGISFSFLHSCKEKAEELKDLPEISIINISQESEWDYWVVGNNGDYYFVTEENSMPKHVYFHPASGSTDYSIQLDQNGYPDKMIADGYIFIFRNFNGNKLDIGVISPNGDIEILRGITSDFDWNSIGGKGCESIQAWSDVIRWTGRAIAGIPCALSVAATVTTSGAAWPLMAWQCGNYLFKLSGLIAEDFGVHNGFTEFVSIYRLSSLGLNCASAKYLECATGATSRAFEEWADSMEEVELQKNNVLGVEATLSHGYGDVQINLTWSNDADLDLHVIDPYGEEIYWQHTSSLSGGILDVDDIDGKGPENIYWPEGDAPNGNYDVYVHHYVWSSQPGRPESSDYTVIVSAFDKIATFKGSIAKGQAIFIARINQNGITSGSKQLLNITVGCK